MKAALIIAFAAAAIALIYVFTQKSPTLIGSGNPLTPGSILPGANNNMAVGPVYGAPASYPQSGVLPINRSPGNNIVISSQAGYIPGLIGPGNQPYGSGIGAPMQPTYTPTLNGPFVATPPSNPVSGLPLPTGIDLGIISGAPTYSSQNDTGAWYYDPETETYGMGVAA